MMQESLQTKKQRQEAYDWLYQTISPKYIRMVEDRFDQDSDLIPAFKALIAHRIAIETAMIFDNAGEYHPETYRDIKKQLSSHVTSVIHKTQNPWLQKCFKTGLQFHGTTEEFKLRQDIIIELQKSFDFLRTEILGPEIQKSKAAIQKSFKIEPWIWALIGVGIVCFGVFFSSLALTILMNKELMITLGTLLSIMLIARWSMEFIPSMWRSMQFRWQFGTGLGTKEREHLANLHPDHLVGEKNQWFGFILNSSNQSGVNETWVDLDEWLMCHFNLYPKQKIEAQTNLSSTPGKPLSFNSVRFFKSCDSSEARQQALAHYTGSVSKV